MKWQSNWPETKRHFTDWWNHRGLVLSTGGFPAVRPHESVPEAGKPPDGLQYHTAPVWRARANHHRLAGRDHLADSLPLASIDIGPGSLALLLGSEPGVSPETVWFEPTMKDDAEPEKRPPLKFDPDNRWARIHEESARACAALARGKYGVGCPDLVENIDIISAMRDPQTLMMDMIERPGWVEEKVWEINQAWFEAYSRLYEIIKMEDGSACFNAFALWGPGKTAKVQCDACAMFSPAMFRRFVKPALTAQCEWLDYSMYHLDGHQCICHLDELLSIEALDAIEWTPDPTVPKGGSPQWYPLYRRILAAGKSVQAVGVNMEEAIPLFDAVGGKGMYVMVNNRNDRAAFEKLMERVEAYR